MACRLIIIIIFNLANFLQCSSVLQIATGNTGGSIPYQVVVDVSTVRRYPLHLVAAVTPSTTLAAAVQELQARGGGQLDPATVEPSYRRQKRTFGLAEEAEDVEVWQEQQKEVQ